MKVPGSNPGGLFAHVFHFLVTVLLEYLDRVCFTCLVFALYISLATTLSTLKPQKVALR